MEVVNFNQKDLQTLIFNKTLMTQSLSQGLCFCVMEALSVGRVPNRQLQQNPPLKPSMLLHVMLQKRLFGLRSSFQNQEWFLPLSLQFHSTLTIMKLLHKQRKLGLTSDPNTQSGDFILLERQLEEAISPCKKQLQLITWLIH